MRDKLREYVEKLFVNAPNTKQSVEIKEEILQNTIDRYNDLIAEGKTEEAAFNISVAGIGDVDMLIKSMMAPKSTSGFTKEEIMKNKKRNSILLSVAIMLYILCVVPPILFSGVNGGETYDIIGVVLMFVIAAIATGLIIYRAGTTIHYNKSDDTVVENFKEWNSKKNEESSVIKAINGIIWSMTLVIYFIVSFITGAWYISWIIFLIGAVASNILRAIFDLRK